MPIYEFYCADCRQESEVLVRSSEWKGTPCPYCGSQQLQKRLSLFAPASASAPAAPCMPACGANPESCGMCCGAGPHSH